MTLFGMPVRRFGLHAEGSDSVGICKAFHI